MATSVLAIPGFGGAEQCSFADGMNSPTAVALGAARWVRSATILLRIGAGARRGDAIAGHAGRGMVEIDRPPPFGGRSTSSVSSSRMCGNDLSVIPLVSDW
eukprot:CAMPEP_0176130528 /NCGR_PEP_ID=MMETSP0120_2-20121206/66047_1 /TAXON_ID=160619 /ORGANISM="Kryptoperidinium foliaceum, Strain CCMP 1326" /LENGTH=100 /DNA_ID=CAMNT_0017465827 /DNA_START=144 /DNA_END=444 /DNA_ORIENTATION=+